MFNRLLRTAFALTLISAAISCSSNDSKADGYLLRIGATSVTGTPAGSLGWGDKQGILAEQLEVRRGRQDRVLVLPVRQ